MKVLFGISVTAWVWSVVGLALAADSPQFRGPTRNGVYPETGLLKEWPEGGPAMKWSVSGLGLGFSSVAVAGGMVYTTGMKEAEGTVFAYGLDGTLKWRKDYGTEHHGGGYPGSRTTPTIDGGNLYLISSKGKAVCLDAASGDEKWSVDTLERFKGNKHSDALIPRWSIAESVLVMEDKVICTPGGPDATVVALNRENGATIWTSKGLSDLSGYCSARLFDHGGIRQIITMTEKSMVGINPEKGEVLWTESYPAAWNIHAVSPVFHENMVYVSDGYGKGGKTFELAANGKGVKLKWEEPRLDVHHGGVVAVDGNIYGAATNGDLICLDFKSGQVQSSIDAVGKGSVIYADGMLYAYGEKGVLGLIEANPKQLTMKGSFKVTLGDRQHWSHPAISDGTLYLRHGDVLMAYDIRAN